jgi:hypothetical protein
VITGWVALSLTPEVALSLTPEVALWRADPSGGNVLPSPEVPHDAAVSPVRLTSKNMNTTRPTSRVRIGQLSHSLDDVRKVHAPARGPHDETHHYDASHRFSNARGRPTRTNRTNPTERSLGRIAIGRSTR